jgi:hypothetical protein
MSGDALVCPARSEHGPLRLRANPSQEAAWCGTWYDCERCKSSILIESAELRAANAELLRQHASQGKLFDHALPRKRNTRGVHK